MRTQCWILVVFLALISGVSAAESLNDKVIAFCVANVEKEVGNGECAGLAFQALKAAGAKTRNGPDAPQERDYVWGKQVYKMEATADGIKETGKIADVQPGDIIQFRDVNFGGSGGFAHHTAIVAEVASAEQAKFEVYQQNAGGKRFCFKTTLHKFKDMKEGYIIFYRPIPEHK